MVDLRFNFIGVNAADFERAFAFYTEVQGVRPAKPSSPAEADSWAMLVAGWDESPAPDGHGLRCELFERAIEPPAERRWGRNQNVRPSIQVADLPVTKETLHDRGVTFTGAIADTDTGQSVEFMDPDVVRWSLAQAADLPAGPGMETPHIGWVELKAADVDRQVDFYTRTMGLTAGDRTGSRVRLQQGSGDPLVFVQSGGERVTVEGEQGSPFDVHRSG